MANIHVLKNTLQETVLKVYSTSSSGETITIHPDSAKVANVGQRFVGSQSELHVKEIYWGAKKDKQIDISRIDDPAANTVHGHYFLINGGHYNFTGFTDKVYANSGIVINGDGPFHVILKLHKNGYVNI